ncbi:kinase-like protein [Aulographum hederae CBS 113979]|uniref:Kinase-like protein n=1 Tax=Aulographum hederae CBS 113979 TaxID=1176131 RepID=A0A6G1GRN9_9PEZI|nr:kinase-like protein [Aulographum hederae CBS 113979]
MSSKSFASVPKGDQAKPSIHANLFDKVGALLPIRTRLFLGEKRWGRIDPKVVRISKKTVLRGPTEAAELEALRYVYEHTSIPVPKVHATYTFEGGLYIEMDFVEGDTLFTAWRKTLSPDQKKVIMKELAVSTTQLRGLEPPRDELVASVNSGPGVDYRVGYRPFGPCFSHEEFHSLLRGGIPLEDTSKVYTEPVTRCHSKSYRTCFSHADITPRNIIVRDGHIAAIIDWQFGGWYPEYWEYTKAHYNVFIEVDWWAEFKEAVDQYEGELEAERALWRLFSEPGDAKHWIVEAIRRQDDDELSKRSGSMSKSIR